MKLFLAAGLRQQFIEKAYLNNLHRLPHTSWLFTHYYEDETKGFEMFLYYIKAAGGKTEDYTFMLDSGAFSFFMEAQKRGVNLASDVDSKEFTDYLERYVKYLDVVKGRVFVPVTIDIGYNPELTWKLWERIIGMGVDIDWLMPVIHNGTNVSWAMRYIERGCKFLGFGGIAAKGLAHPSAYRPWVSMLFKLLEKENLTDKIWVHGLGMTVHEFLFAYPWSAVDSTKWLKISGQGAIVAPIFKRDGSIDLAQNIKGIFIAKNSTKRATKWLHFLTLPKSHQEQMEEYIVSKGFTVEELAVEQPYMRMLWNAMYYAELEAYLTKHIATKPKLGKSMIPLELEGTVR